MQQLQQATSPPMNPHPFGLLVVQPVRDVHPLPNEVLPVSPPKPPLPYALVAAPPQRGAVHRPSGPVPLPLSPPQPRQAPPKDAPSSGAMKRKIPRRRSSMAVMYESLEVRNYHMKFRELLKSEEIAHDKLLKERLVWQNSVSCY